MKKLKASKIIVATTVSTSLIMPNVMAAAAPIQVHNKNIIKENTNESKIGIEVGKIQVIKNVANGTTTNTEYIPENIVPITGDIGTTGTSFQYNVPVEFSSKTGKLYNLENPAIEVELNPSGVDGKVLTSEQKLGIKALENSINIQVQNYSKEWNTSGSYIFSILIGINNSLNGVQLNPTMNLSYKVNGEEKEDSISLGKILLTKRYAANIKANPTIKNGGLTLNIDYSKDEGDIAKYDINNLGYIDGKHNIKSLTFSVSVPKGMTLNPINNPDFIINKNNTYSIKGNLLKEVLVGNIKLFDIKYGDKPISSNIGINLITEPNATTFNNGAETQQGTGVNYENGTVNVQYIPKDTENKKQDKFNLESLDSGIVLGNGNMTNAIKTKFSAKIDSEGGSGVAYVGSCITNGEGVITQNNKNLASKNMIYVQLPTNVLNELTTGTVAEKMNVMEGIINNEYPSYKEGEDLKANFSPNFVYTTSNVEKGESKVVSGSYIKIPKNYNGWSTYPVSASNTIVGIVYNKENISIETVNAFQKSDYDGIEKIKNGDSMLALISSPSGLIQSTMNRALPWNYTQSTFFRDGEFSHGVSASSILTWAVSDTRFDKFDDGATAYNEEGHGISNQWLNEHEQASWLSQPHTINGAMGVNVATDGSIYKKDSYIRVDFGGSAIVTGNIIFNGKVVPSKDVQINSTYAVIKIPEGTLVNLIKVTVPVQYTDMSLKSITTSMSTCNSSGVKQREVYPISRINGYMNSWGMIGYADNTAFTNTVNFIHNTANVCQQYSNGVAKDNTTTITNVVNNLGSGKTTYTIAGRIPSPGNDTLPASVGDLNVGNLGSTLENIDTNGANTWILPNSKLNNLGNKEILDNPYPNTLGNLSQAQLEKLGWIKYEKGMDLKNIGAYLVKVEINPGESYTMHYKIKLTNVNLKKFQATNGEYKYYDTTNNVGSTSPVITLTPNGVNVATDWMSSIVVQNYGKDTKGKTIIESTSELPTNILNETIKDANDSFNNEPKLKDLISNGEDIEDNVDVKTPEKLMKLIKFAVNNKDAFAKLGYRLDYISFNGINIAPGKLGEYSMDEQALMNWLENTGIANNTTLTKVKFVMSPLKSVPVTVGVKVVNNKNEIIQSENTIPEHLVFNGIVGGYLNRDLCKIMIPKGYELVKETVNGSKVTPNADGNTVPEILSQSGDKIIYYITKAPTEIDLKVEYPNGEIINNGEIAHSGIPSENTDMSSNGEKISFAGKEIIIPKGYEVAETKVINKDTGNLISTAIDKINTISAYRNYNIQVIVKLKEIPKYEVTGKVITTTGEIIETLPVTKNYEGEDFTKTPKIPKGYHLVKTTINNKEVKVGKEGSVSGKYINGTENIVWTIEKDPTSTITTEVVDNTGKVLVEKETTTGIVGSKDTSVVPKIPEGYKIEKITDGTLDKNGFVILGNKEISGLPESYTNNVQVIVWHVIKKETTVDIKIIDKNTGKVVEQTKPENIETGSDLSKVILPNIQKHYHIVSVGTNGVVNNSGKVIGAATVKPNEIIINIEENPKYEVTGEVVTQTGKVVETLPVTENYEGEDFVKTPKIPEGYHLIKTRVNDKEVTVGKDGTVSGKYSNVTENIIWTIEKNSTDTIAPAETDKGKDTNKNTSSNDINKDTSSSDVNKNKDTNSNEINKNKDTTQKIDTDKKTDTDNSKIENSSSSKEQINNNNSEVKEKSNETKSKVKENNKTKTENNNETKSEQEINQNEQKNNNKEVNNSDKSKNVNKGNEAVENQNSKVSPQTGDKTELPMVIVIIVALLALLGINRKKK